MNDVLRWLSGPAPWAPATASRGDMLWLTLSLVFGLAFTAYNLVDAYRTDRARRAEEPADQALRTLAHGHIDKAWCFAGIDFISVVIGIWSVFNWAGLPGVVVLGLLLIRVLLSAVAYRDLRLRKQMFALQGGE